MCVCDMWKFPGPGIEPQPQPRQQPILPPLCHRGISKVAGYISMKQSPLHIENAMFSNLKGQSQNMFCRNRLKRLLREPRSTLVNSKRDRYPWKSIHLYELSRQNKNWIFPQQAIEQDELLWPLPQWSVTGRMILCHAWKENTRKETSQKMHFRTNV